MPSDAPAVPDLALIGRLMSRLTAELAGLRQETRSVIAALRRIERRQEWLLRELRAFRPDLPGF